MLVLFCTITYFQYDAWQGRHDQKTMEANAQKQLQAIVSGDLGTQAIESQGTQNDLKNGQLPTPSYPQYTSGGIPVIKPPSMK